MWQRLRDGQEKLQRAERSDGNISQIGEGDSRACARMLLFDNMCDPKPHCKFPTLSGWVTHSGPVNTACPEELPSSDNACCVFRTLLREPLLATVDHPSSSTASWQSEGIGRPSKIKRTKPDYICGLVGG